jgi:signal transduction histidine kinase
MLTNLGYSNAKNVDKVTLQLRWEHQFQFAGYYAAKWKGYYKDEGIEVSIVPAVSSNKQILSATNEVLEGRADFGIGSADILLANDKGADLRILATVFQRSAARFYLKKQTPYKSIADLVKLRVARQVNSLIDLEFQAILINEGIDPNSVKAYKHEPGLKHLVSDRVEVMPGYNMGTNYFAKIHGVKIKEINPINYGVDFYGDSMFARGDFIEKNPELVERFRRASLKGWEYALNNKKEISKTISLKLNSLFFKGDYFALNIYQSKVVTGLMHYPIVEIGHTNPKRWKSIHNYLTRAGIVKKEINLTKLIFDYEKLIKNRARKSARLIRYVLIGISVIVVMVAIGVYFRSKFKAEKERQVFYTQIKKYNDDLKRLLYISSHDLRTPLVNIDGFVNEISIEFEFLLKKINNSSNIDEIKTMINEYKEDVLNQNTNLVDASVLNMERFIKGLLRLSLVGGRELEKKSVDLEQVCSSVKETLNINENNKKMKLTIGKLPIILSDEFLIEGILTNLISNASKNLCDDKIGQIEVSSVDRKDKIVFIVKDNGIGIPTDEHEKIFDFFYRIKGVPDEQGLGVGLSITKWATQKLGGEITLESEVGKGSSFFVSLPKY